MAVLSLDQAARLTELGKITIDRAIRCSWLSARHREDGSYEIDAREPEPSASRLQALIPWRASRSVRAMANAELRERVAVAEERIADSRSRLMTCARSETHGRRWHRREYDRRQHQRSGGGLGFARLGN
jgi:hypothetical protein